MADSKKNVVLHELGHAIGLAHEHQHWDRDKHLIINYQHIKKQDHIWYNVLDRSVVDTYGVPYDPYSVMHYGKGYGKVIMQTRDPNLQNVIGYVKGLSAGDKLIVNRMYNCPNKVETKKFEERLGSWPYIRQELGRASNIASHTKCAEDCSTRPQCNGYSYLPQSKHCYVWKGAKWSVSIKTTWNTYIEDKSSDSNTGKFKRISSRWVGSKKQLFQLQGRPSWESCEGSCVRTSGCDGYAWNTSGACYLFQGSSLDNRPSAWNVGILNRNGGSIG